MYRLFLLALFVKEISANHNESLFNCNRNDSSWDNCIKETMQLQINQLKNTSEGSIDPINIHNYRFYFTSPISLLKTVVVHAKIRGLSDIKIQKVWSSFSGDDMRLVFVFSIPALSAEGYYKGEGRFINVKGGPRGFFNGTMAEITTTMKMSVSPKSTSGKSFLEIDDIVQTAQHIYSNIEGLFPDRDLNQLINDYLNQYWRTFYREMFNETQKFWQFLYAQLFVKLFANTSLQQ